MKEAINGLTAGISRPSTEKVMSGRISALSETVRSECFATRSANLTVGRLIRPILYMEDEELAIELYEVNPKYINYLVPYAPHLFHNC